jgi:benzoyl-CoA reductase/2-hydroxyglutaryl-CoA dehydratase subunit BcrC/BadD/HgdB
MRHAAAVVACQSHLPSFLMNVPATWQTHAAQTLYLEELRRLGRFLVEVGGSHPTNHELLEAMFRYQQARTTVQAAHAKLSPRRFAAAMVELRGEAMCDSGPLRVDVATSTTGTGVPLAIVGGPLLPEDGAVFDLIEEAGGRIVLDATEGGQRTLPACFDRQRAEHNPLEELAAAYFGSIPDVFRRPNDRLYQWLGQHMTASEVRGIVFRRYLWCDLWHAELQRLKQWSPVPVLDLDMADDDGVPARLLGRLEAFVEMLRPRLTDEGPRPNDRHRMS